MLVGAGGQGLEVHHAFYYPEFDSPGQPNPLTPFLAQILWVQMEKLSVEGLYHPVAPFPTPISGEPARGGPGYLMGLLSPTILFLYLPTLAPSQTNCKNCSWSKWSSARSWSENFRVSKVPHPDPPHLITRALFPQAPG